jgi:hypothetical protein
MERSLSSSSEATSPAGSLHTVAASLEKIAGSVTRDPNLRGDLQADISAALTYACRIYADLSELPETTPPVSALIMSPTEACVVAAALLRSVSLTPFEFAIWFSGGGPGGQSPADSAST